MGLALLGASITGPVCSCTTSYSQHVEQKCRRTVCSIQPPPTGLAKGFLGRYAQLSPHTTAFTLE